jgi:hypothetical protein
MICIFRAQARMHLGSRITAAVSASILVLGFVSCSPDEAVHKAPRPPIEVGSSTAALKRLTASQYRQAVHDLLGEAIAVPTSLEPDVAVEGFFTVGAAQSGISALGVERYESAAYDIAKQALSAGADRDALVGCTPDSARDDGCARRFVESFGRRAWRRPLAEAEVARLVAIAGAGADKLGDFHQGLEFALGALLMSPNFLFRVEVGEDHDGRVRFTAQEMAMRVSFFLWNTTPDEELLAAAEAGELTDRDRLAAHVDRMLASPRAAAGIKAFFEERFELHKLEHLLKDSTVFTSTSAELGGYAREETLRTAAYLLLDRELDYRELFTTRETFVNRKLAALYAVPAPSLDDFALTTLPADGPRAGLLGHASILALFAHPVSSSATLRGKFIRTQLLCANVPPPPADVDTSLPEPSERMPTLRDRIGDHLTNPVCATCHRFMDPIGLGLEQFDGIGRWRTTENDFPIDPSGELDGRPFGSAVELGAAIAAHPDLPRCLVEHLHRYAVGTPYDSGDEALVAELAQTFADGEYRIKPLLRHIVLSDGFRFVRGQEDAEP